MATTQTIQTLSPQLAKFVSNFAKGDGRLNSNPLERPGILIDILRQTFAKIGDNASVTVGTSKVVKHAWAEQRWSVANKKWEDAPDGRKGTTTSQYVVPYPDASVIIPKNTIVGITLAENPDTGENVWLTYTPNGFWAKIGCHCLLSKNRWKYSFTEQTRTSTGFSDKTNGIVGDCTVTDSTAIYGLNSVETNNKASGVQGNSVDDTVESPDGNEQFMLPVMGSPVVWMHVDLVDAGSSSSSTGSTFASVAGSSGSTAATSTTVFTFEYVNQERDYGDEPDDNDCTQSNVCVHTWTATYSCPETYTNLQGNQVTSTGSWSFSAYQGVVCGKASKTSGTWVPTSDPCTYQYTLNGDACQPTDDLASKCPQPPTPPPVGTTPDGCCQQNCYFYWTNFYECVVGVWYGATRNGVYCEATPRYPLNTWTLADSCTAVYVTKGPSCPGGDHTEGCGDFPADPPACTLDGSSCCSKPSGGSLVYSTYSSEGSLYSYPYSTYSTAPNCVVSIEFKGCTMHVIYADGTIEDQAIPCCCGQVVNSYGSTAPSNPYSTTPSFTYPSYYSTTGSDIVPSYASSSASGNSSSVGNGSSGSNITSVGSQGGTCYFYYTATLNCPGGNWSVPTGGVPSSYACLSTPPANVGVWVNNGNTATLILSSGSCTSASGCSGDPIGGNDPRISEGPSFQGDCTVNCCKNTSCCYDTKHSTMTINNWTITSSGCDGSNSSTTTTTQIGASCNDGCACWGVPCKVESTGESDSYGYGNGYGYGGPSYVVLAITAGDNNYAWSIQGVGNYSTADEAIAACSGGNCPFADGDDFNPLDPFFWDYTDNYGNKTCYDGLQPTVTCTSYNQPFNGACICADSNGNNGLKYSGGISITVSPGSCTLNSSGSCVQSGSSNGGSSTGSTAVSSTSTATQMTKTQQKIATRYSEGVHVAIPNDLVEKVNKRFSHVRKMKWCAGIGIAGSALFTNYEPRDIDIVILISDWDAYSKVGKSLSFPPFIDGKKVEVWPHAMPLHTDHMILILDGMKLYAPSQYKILSVGEGITLIEQNEQIERARFIPAAEMKKVKAKEGGCGCGRKRT